MTTALASETTLQLIPVAELLESPLNPRRRFDQQRLNELADSIRKSGILTPLLVRPRIADGAPLYEIAAGHRRYRAAKLAGVEEAPCAVREMDDREFLE